MAYLLGGWWPRAVTACFLGLCLTWGLWGLTRLSGGGVAHPFSGCVPESGLRVYHAVDGISVQP